jgi:hypothetical protein
VLLVSQVHERGHRLGGVAAGPRGRRRRRGPTLLEHAYLLAELQDDEVRLLLADAGHGDEPARVAVGDRVLQVLGVHAGEHPDRDLRPDRRDLEQEEEERTLGRLEETIELERVLAHVRVHVEVDLHAGIGQAVEGVERGEELVADAPGVDDDLLGRLFEEPAAKTRDHRGPVAAAAASTAEKRDDNR